MVERPPWFVGPVSYRPLQHALPSLVSKNAKLLARDDLLGGLMVKCPETNVINEHAHHALADFCSAVYGAWAKFGERLAQRVSG